jgi:hypothetical protein
MILLLVFLIMNLSLIIHEIGQFIAGAFLQYRFLFLIAGSFVISKRNGIMSIGINGSKTDWGQCGINV